MVHKTFTATLEGLRPVIIEAEVDANQGTPILIVIGLPSRIIDEAKERVTSALVHCGIRIRSKRTIVNLAPAEVKKSSSAVELAIAIGILKLYGEITCDTDDTLFLGELSLDGSLRPIKGLLPLVLAAKERGFKKVLFPHQNQGEVGSISGITLHPIQHLQQYLDHTRVNSPLPLLKPTPFEVVQQAEHAHTLDDVRGQEFAKRALEIAAAGGHNLLMTGPPGVGKSLLAKCFSSILPPLTEKESLEVTPLYSVLGLHSKLITQRPFRSPHHTTSVAGLVGGGSQLSPGEISLAHNGVLFLDEIAEFPKATLEALRQPLEEGVVTLSRASGTATYPAQFCLLAATNPCPCGYRGSSRKACTCSEYSISSYQGKLSGPIKDRIDLFVPVRSEKSSTLAKSSRDAAKATQSRQRVSQARVLQHSRYEHIAHHTNAQLTSKEVDAYCQLTTQAQQLLHQATQKHQISARSYFKLIKVAQTISDLANDQSIKVEHMAEALQYREEGDFSLKTKNELIKRFQPRNNTLQSNEILQT